MAFNSGVLTGDEVTQLFNHAKKNNFAIPAVNVTGSNSINAVLESASIMESPIIIQFSNAGAHFIAGKSLPNNKQQGSIIGAVSAAKHVHEVADLYGVTVLLHTDHANREMLPWLDGLFEENRKYIEQFNKPLFSSHMLDLSTEPIEKSLETYRTYLKKMSSLGITLEIELGLTGGIEEGFDHSNVDQSVLYTAPEEVARVYKELSKINDKFTIAAAFGNIHGVYNPGKVKLKPKILRQAQNLIKKELGTKNKPVSYVFHGGSGCTRQQIREAISYGTVKMNINTDLQWAFWEGIKSYYQQNESYLKTQIGNPEGSDKSNKPYYNPQVWLREGEQSIIKRLSNTFEDLNCVNQNS